MYVSFNMLLQKKGKGRYGLWRQEWMRRWGDYHACMLPTSWHVQEASIGAYYLRAAVQCNVRHESASKWTDRAALSHPNNLCVHGNGGRLDCCRQACMFLIDQLKSQARRRISFNSKHRCLIALSRQVVMHALVYVPFKQGVMHFYGFDDVLQSCKVIGCARGW